MLFTTYGIPVLICSPGGVTMKRTTLTLRLKADFLPQARTSCKCISKKRKKHEIKVKKRKKTIAHAQRLAWKRRRMLATIIDTELAEAPMTPTTFSGLTNTGGSPFVHLTSEVSFVIKA